MTGKKKITLTRLLAFLVLAPWSLVVLVTAAWPLSCTSQQTESHEAVASPTPSWMLTATASMVQDPEVAVAAPEEPKVDPKEEYVWVDPNTALGEHMGLCEEPLNVVHIDPKTGKEIIPKKRKITSAEQARMKRNIVLIAKEMGANPDLFLIWALRESSYRWFKRHRLNPDMEAAGVAWQKYRHSDGREAQLMAVMEEGSAKNGTKGYWNAKAELERISVYRDNPTYEADWRWATGYGLYGMQPVYHLKRWDRNAAPELLCDPVVATIVAIWAARSSKSVCSSTGYGDSYQVVNRSYSTGHCESSGRESYFVKRAERRGLDYLAPAQLGSKWPQKTTDRAEILAYMNERIAEADAAEAD